MYRTRGGKQKQLQIVQLRRLIDGYFRLVKTNGKRMARMVLIVSVDGAR